MWHVSFDEPRCDVVKSLRIGKYGPIYSFDNYLRDDDDPRETIEIGENQLYGTVGSLLNDLYRCEVAEKATNLVIKFRDFRDGLVDSLHTLVCESGGEIYFDPNDPPVLPLNRKASIDSTDHYDVYALYTRDADLMLQTTAVRCDLYDEDVSYFSADELYDLLEIL